MDPQPSQPHQLKLSLDYRFVVVALVLVIVGMLAVWRPWVTQKNDSRVVTATGTTTIKSTPDEYVFSPTYTFRDTNKDVALANLTKKSNDITAQLKSLGVTDVEIKTNSAGSEGGYYYTLTPGGQPTYTLSYVITLNNQDLVQKVQDYLVTTAPSGSVSPQPTFSQAKQKSLDTQARDAAAKDARTNAEQMAKTLGYKLGAVQSVSDNRTGGIMPMPMGIKQVGGGVGKLNTSSLPVQPGVNDLTYNVEVVYYIY